MREELKYVFDKEIRGDDTASRSSAVNHLREMENPSGWILDQVDFDKDLLKAKKISNEEYARRYQRWMILRDRLAA